MIVIKSFTLTSLITSVCVQIDNPNRNLFFAFHPEQARRCYVMGAMLTNSLDDTFTQIEKTTERYVVDLSQTYIPTYLQVPLAYGVQIMSNKGLRFNLQNVSIFVSPSSVSLGASYSFD